MSSKTKIVVLHMKELIYTGIFVVLGIVLLVFLVILFLPGNREQSSADPSPAPTTEASPLPDTTVSSSSLYIPGIYRTDLVLNNQVINVEVIVDESRITSIKMVHLDEAVTTMYPLLQTTFDSLVSQIYETQSLDDISYSQESKYTSLVLLETIRKTIDKATP